MIGAAKLAANTLYESAGDDSPTNALAKHRPRRRGRNRARTPYEGMAVDNHFHDLIAQANSSDRLVLPCQSERRALEGALKSRNYEILLVQPVYVHAEARYEAHADLLCKNTNTGEKIIVECKAGCRGNHKSMQLAKLQAALQVLAEHASRQRDAQVPPGGPLKATVLCTVASRGKRAPTKYACSWHDVEASDMDIAARVVSQRVAVSRTETS
jgi:hypothetical protein